MADQPLRVTVWHEYRHDNPQSESPNAQSMKLYPEGMHAEMKSAIEQHLGDTSRGVQVTTCTLDQDENHGLSDELLANTDVMTWWGHMGHDLVKDEWAQKVAQRVREGMGLVVPALGALLQTLQNAHGHQLPPALARSCRKRTLVVHDPRPPHHLRTRKRLHRARTHRNVRRTLRHSRPPTN